MERVVRDNKVAVLYSPGHGAGWYSWHNIPELLFDSSVVQWLEARELDKIKNYITLKYPGKYFGSLDTLAIRWIPVGTEFIIDEYDGSETIRYKESIPWLTA